MLTSLKIENVAVIEKAEAHFGAGLNVLTGETGAGKSILIDSINAILGSRTSRELVRTGAAKACIRATFEHIPAQVMHQLETAGYEASEDLLLYREISAEGKGSCRINGEPATAAVVREICAGLINIHGQNDSHSLTNPARHLGLLDSFAQNQAQHDSYYALYRQLIVIKRKMDALSMDEAERQRRIEALRYEVEEIDAASLQEGEEDALQARRQVAAHAQGILESVMAAQVALAGGDDYDGAADMLGSASTQLTTAAQLDESLKELSEQLNGIYYTAREIAVDLADKLDEYSIDPSELDRIEQRLDQIYRLKRKYGDSEAEILAHADKAREELNTIESSTEELEKLDKEKKRLYLAAREAAEVLTQSRLDAFAQMNERIIAALKFLNMPGVRFTLMHKRGPLASAGQDTIEFYISANPGEEPKPMAKVASGGELSRIMLSIKSALADRDSIPTIIYDEIDTGVSGSAAGRIGQMLKSTSRGRQILCITHTAQIAALADEHLLIKKNVTADKTFTEIHPLDEDGRVREVARITSGDHITDLALASAREMIETGRKEAENMAGLA